MTLNNKTIKASFRECAISDRKCFCSSKCIMPISIGQKIHEGEKFLATLRLINKYFQTCTILVDDSVQRFTLKINEPNSSIEELHINAIKYGDEWLGRSKKLHELLTIPYNIMRWDDWRTHDSFKKSYKVVESLYNNDESYRQAIHANIDDYLARYVINNKTEFDKKYAFDCCLQYLKEECSVMCLWPLGEYHFEVYPSGRNKAMAATYEKIIKPNFPHLLKSVALRFKK